jgi:hypothetical protein
MVPLPCFSVPSQTADPVRVAIVLSPLFVGYDSRRMGAGAICFQRDLAGVAALLPGAESKTKGA